MDSFLIRAAFACLLLSIAAIAPAAELPTKKVLSLEITKQIAAAAEKFAKEHDWNVVICIVDEGGHLIYLQRMDGVQTGSVEVAIRKATAAAAFKRPTKLFEEAVAGGRTALVALPGGMPFEGGVPLMAGEQIVGAIGVSGVTAQQDGMIAQSGAEALSKILSE